MLEKRTLENNPFYFVGDFLGDSSISPSIASLVEVFADYGEFSLIGSWDRL
jgi:hypothetical protein